MWANRPKKYYIPFKGAEKQCLQKAGSNAVAQRYTLACTLFKALHTLKKKSEIIKKQVDKELADLYLILQKYFSFEDKKDFPVERLINFKKKEQGV